MLESLTTSQIDSVSTIPDFGTRISVLFLATFVLGVLLVLLYFKMRDVESRSKDNEG